jgi:hypothetical protein
MKNPFSHFYNLFFVKKDSVDPTFFSPERVENRKAIYKFLADGEVSKSLVKPTRS